MAALVPLTIGLAILTARAGEGRFTIGISVVLAVVFIVNMTYHIPLKIEELEAEQHAE